MPVRINLDKIVSFDTVLTELTKLENSLSKSELNQFELFNKAYFVVTRDIKNAAAGGNFEKPKFVEKFTVSFAHYYFRAINETVVSSKDLPLAWAKLNKTEKHKSAPKFITLMMGANAHINHDLPLALLKLMEKEKTEDLLKDVLKIDKILMKSGREIIGLFDEPNSTLNFLKRNFIFLYYRPAMYTILYWRIRAWKNYRNLKEVGLKQSSYQGYSVKIADRLLRILFMLN